MCQTKTFTVKEWSDDDKPREKLIKHGPKALTTTELLAILLRSGVQGKNVVELAREMYEKSGNSLTTLSRLDYHTISSIKGMAEAKATTLMAALELGWRMQSEIQAERKTVITNSKDIFRTISRYIGNLDHEEFWAIFANARNEVIECRRISSGGMTETSVDLRIIFRNALEAKAINMAVAHNHPSGSLKPSRQDEELTKRIHEASKLLSVRLLDHIIVGTDTNGKPNYYSFFDDGRL